MCSPPSLTGAKGMLWCGSALVAVRRPFISASDVRGLPAGPCRNPPRQSASQRCRIPHPAAMLTDGFAAVALEAVDLPDLQWTGVAQHLQTRTSTQSAGAGDDAGGEDGTRDPDTVACLRVSGSSVASLRGLDGYRSLLALAVPHNGLTSLDDQVRPRAP